MQNYFKQALASLRSQPMASWTTIAGTTLAIFLIMVTVMMEDIRIAPYAPESGRDRWLVHRFTSIKNNNWGNDQSSNAGFNTKVAKAVFMAMETPEAVTTLSIAPSEALVSMSNGKSFGAQLLDVDHGFWKVMDFTFISGTPFGEAEFESAQPVAVISESVARKLFGSTDVTGRRIEIDHNPYRVIGVVRDVSTLAHDAYADVWVPYTTTNTAKHKFNEYLGSLKSIILPHSREEIPKVREEYDRLWAKLGDEGKADGWEFIPRDRPYDQETAVNTMWANVDPDMASVRKSRYIIWAVLLLVPAVNLSSMTHSRLSRRREEIGVRRAFGATRGEILTDLFVENLIITLFSGLLGLLLSVMFAFFGTSMIFAEASVTGEVTNLTAGMLLNWHVFGLALIFCLVLNLLSATLPAWQASRTNVVNAIAGKK